MNARHVLVVGAACLLATVTQPGCSLPTGAETELVKSLNWSPSAFNPFVSISSLRYTLSDPATVSVRIVAVDSSGTKGLVFTLADAELQTEGSHALSWKGIGTTGTFIPQGRYTAELRATPLRIGQSSPVHHAD